MQMIESRNTFPYIRYSAKKKADEESDSACLKFQIYFPWLNRTGKGSPHPPDNRKKNPQTIRSVFLNVTSACHAPFSYAALLFYGTNPLLAIPQGNYHFPSSHGSVRHHLRNILFLLIQRAYSFHPPSHLSKSAFLLDTSFVCVLPVFDLISE